MRQWLLLPLGCIVLTTALLAPSCDGDKEDRNGPQSPTAEIGATATPAPSATPRDVEARTGIPEIDAFIDALLVEPARARREALRTFFGSTQQACSFRSDRVGQGLNPPCRIGEEERQIVDAFRFDSCGTNLLRADAVDQPIILLGSASLYAVYRAPANAEQPADYIAIVYDEIGGEAQATQLPFLEGHIISYLFSCTQTPEDYIVALGLSDLVYQAEGGE